MEEVVLLMLQCGKNVVVFEYRKDIIEWEEAEHSFIKIKLK